MLCLCELCKTGIRAGWWSGNKT